jgi:hypothetical protein
MSVINLKKLAYHREAKRLPKAKPPRLGPREKFLKGPIPWSWLSKGARLKGHALHIGIALWFLAGLKRSQSVALSNSVLHDLGVSRFSGYRALHALESAGLISVDRHTGRNPVVTILDVGGGDGVEVVSVAQSIVESLDDQKV